jgi:putative transcriptional regulator
MKSFAGQLLIAIPDLGDTNFFRTVVLLIEHTTDGAVGVVLNRPGNMTLKKLWNALAAEIPVKRLDFVHIGGPVQGPILALHNEGDWSDSQVIDGVYMTMAGEILNHLVSDTKCQLKTFTGYSGWGPNQLESEIKRGGWLLHPAEPRHVFCQSHELWKDVCESVGREIMFAGLALDTTPNNAHWN